MNEYIEKNINDDFIIIEKEMTQEDYNSYIKNIKPLIGELVIVFNILENSVDYIIKEVVSDDLAQDEIAYIFLSEIMYSTKINILLKLYNYQLRNTKKDYKVALNELKQKLNEAGNIRNSIIHADWTDVTNDYYVKIKTKVKEEGAKNIYKILDKEIIKNQIDFINEVNNELNDFDEEYIDH